MLNTIQNHAKHVCFLLLADYTGLIHITHGLYGDAPDNKQFYEKDLLLLDPTILNEELTTFITIRADIKSKNPANEAGSGIHPGLKSPSVSVQ